MDRYKWDTRFLRLAADVGQWSKDPSSKVGAVIADGKRIVTLGYNGFPPHVEDKAEWLNDRQKRLELTRHAEDNAIDFAMPQDLFGATIYTMPFPPCTRCAERIVRAGIERVVTIDYIPERWKPDMTAALRYFREHELEVTIYTRIYSPAIAPAIETFFEISEEYVNELCKA